MQTGLFGSHQHPQKQLRDTAWDPTPDQRPSLVNRILPSSLLLPQCTIQYTTNKNRKRYCLRNHDVTGKYKIRLDFRGP
uniref:Uncharacterized protein n=1 Tax=Solanum lycopersicum TaxID=4081 RepID=A0A3Q7ELJ0_SOLLC